MVKIAQTGPLRTLIVSIGYLTLTQSMKVEANLRDRFHHHYRESIMSAMNGDRSRFHRVRKQKIARRMRDREMMNDIEKQRKLSTALSGAKPKPESRDSPVIA